MDTDELPELLDDPYTRQLLRCLREEGGELSLRQLARRVAASVQDEPIDDVDRVTCRQIETFLHHGQLPELSKNGLIRYDADASRVVLRSDDNGFKQ